MNPEGLAAPKMRNRRKFVVRFSYTRVAKGRVFSETEYSDCHTFSKLRTTDFTATHQQKHKIIVGFASVREQSVSVGRYDQNPQSAEKVGDSQSGGGWTVNNG